MLFSSKSEEKLCGAPISSAARNLVFPFSTPPYNPSSRRRRDPVFSSRSDKLISVPTPRHPDEGGTLYFHCATGTLSFFTTSFVFCIRIYNYPDMKSALFLFILCCGLQSNAQPVTELKETDVYFRPTLTIPGKLRVTRTADSTLLPAGHYKTSGSNRYTLFQVGDSGYLNGSYKNFTDQAIYREVVYINGLVSREYFIINGTIHTEAFDSTVTVLLYDPKKNKWNPELKSVRVEKEYGQKGRRLILSFTKGPYNAYARYKYVDGILVSELIPHYLEKKMDPSGKLYQLVQYNWTLKQIETSEFEKDILTTKTILKNLSTVWDPKGIVHFTDDTGRFNDIVTYTYYDGKKFRKKEVERNKKRTVTEYDPQGKITSVNTYPLQTAETETEVAPVEVKQ